MSCLCCDRKTNVVKRSNIPSQSAAVHQPRTETMQRHTEQQHWTDALSPVDLVTKCAFAMKGYKEKRFKEDDDWSDPANDWVDLDGAQLEPALKSGAISLLSAQWLVKFVSEHRQSRRALMLPPRQQLPKEAFLSLEEVIACTTTAEHGAAGLRIVMMSYMWLSPDHPDPKKTTLELISDHLEALLRNELKQYYKFTWSKKYHRPEYAVFWDWASLHQHPDPHSQVYRTQEEQNLFNMGLESLASFYSHPHVHCLQVTKFPLNYPHGYKLPAGANLAEYDQRGWPFIESRLMRIQKQASIHDISQPQNTQLQKKRPPLIPERIDKLIEQMTFTNAKDDRPLTSKLYQNEIQRLFEERETIRYYALGNDGIANLCELIEYGYVPKMTELNLRANNFDWQGYQALANALTSQKSEMSLTHLDLGDNEQIEDDAIMALASALVRIPKVNLRKCKVGFRGCQAIAAAFQKAQEQKTAILLSELYLIANTTIDSQTITVLAHWLVRYLELLDMDFCRVGDAGCRAFADAAIAFTGERMALRELRLRKNEITRDGVSHLMQFLEASPNVEIIKADEEFADELHSSHPLKASPRIMWGYW